MLKQLVLLKLLRFFIHSMSLCELACDVSSLQLLVNCIERTLLGENRSPWQHGFDISIDKERSTLNGCQVLGQCKLI